MKSTKNRAISIMICLLMLAQIVPSSWSSVPVFAYSPEPEEMANTKNDIDLPIDPFHVLSYVSAKPATCTDSGNKAYYACSDCGKWFEDSLGTVEITDKSSVVIPASGHTPAEAVRENEVAATCCAAGSYDEVVYCSVCHEAVSREQKTIPIDEDAHDWGEWVQTKAPTETEPGEETRTCKNDPSHIETRGISVLGHTHNLTFVPAKNATCAEAGNKAYYTCSGCDKWFEEASGTAEITDKSSVVIPAAEHTPAEAVRENEVAATCCAAGSYDEVIYCSVCHEEVSREPKTIPIDEDAHDWGEGVQNGTPTCTEGASVTYTCTGCGKTKTETSNSLGHDWSEWTDDGEDSPTDTHSRTCKRDSCDAAESESHGWSRWVKIDDKTHKKSCFVCEGTRTVAHNLDDGVVTKEATHLETGVKTFTCTDLCGYYYTEDIPKTAEHQWGEWLNNNNNGTHSRFCACNEVETKDCEWDDGVVDEPPTHTELGTMRFTCTVCKANRTEEIPKTAEHSFGDWRNFENAPGNHYRECACGDVEMLPHNWGAWVEQTAGEYMRTCGDCGVSEAMTLDEEKPVNTTSNDNAANTNLTNTDIELIDKILTDQEQSQVAEGAEVMIYLKVEDITNDTPTEHKKEAEAKAGDAEIGMYLDINLFKQVGDTTEKQVTETDGTVCVTITIPDNLINTDPSVTRTYKIIRVYEDENGNLITDVIEGIFNPEDNTYIFETDKFSTYALAYEDLDSPQPGDNSMMGLWIALLFVFSFGVVTIAVYGNKRKSVK